MPFDNYSRFSDVPKQARPLTDLEKYLALPVSERVSTKANATLMGPDAYHNHKNGVIPSNQSNNNTSEKKE